MNTTTERWGESQDPLSFREVLGFLRRQRLALVISFVLGLVAWGVSLFVIPTEYRVYTSFTIDARGTNGAAQSDPFNELSFPDQVGDILTAVQVMQGEDVLGEAFRRANVPAGRIGDQYVDGPKVNITQSGYTNLIEVTVDWTNKDQAQSIATDIPNLFATKARQIRDKTLGQAATFLESQQKQAAQNVTKASDALAAFNAKIATAAGTTDQLEMANRRSQAVATAEAAKADLEGARERLTSLESARNALPKTVRNPGTQSSTARRNALTDDLSQLRSELAQTAVTYTSSSPQVREIKAKIAAKESALKSIPANDPYVTVNRNPQLDVYDDKVAEATAAVKAAEARLQKSNQFLSEVERQASILIGSIPERSRLENSVVEAQKSLDLVNTRNADLQIRKNAVREPLQVVVPPTTSDTPVRPKPLLYLAIALFASTLLGLGVASLREHLDDRITSPELAVRETGAVVIGVLPALHARERLVFSDPRMPRQSADAARLVYQRIETLYGLSSDQEIESMMVTSMARSEERSAFVRNLAAGFATKGKRVIIVSVGATSLLESLGGYSNKIGYSDLLLDPSNVEAAVVATDIEGVSAVTRGSSNTPITAAHAALVHARLSGLADVVLYDGPSYQFSFDVQSLGNVVDATIIAVKPGIPKRNLLGVAADSLRGLRSRFLGIVITGSAAEEVTKEVVRFGEGVA